MAQPFLRSVGLVLAVPDILLEFPYLLFGGLKLVRKLLRNTDRMLDVFFHHTGGPFEQTQNRLASTFQRIGPFGKGMTVSGARSPIRTVLLRRNYSMSLTAMYEGALDQVCSGRHLR
jgi:hypothetical protein